jgi:glyoxylase-like metal-dependent hydrolase (beta-lactamase superfamily II)
MKRRSFIQNATLAFGAMTLAQQQIFGSFFEDPWKIQMLTDDLGIFTERGGTILFTLSKKGMIVVDSQFPDQSKHLIDELRKKSDKPFEILINTHHHGDHTAGNISFKGIVGHVLAHANSLKNQKNVAVTNKNEDKQLFPDQTYTETWSEKIAKQKVTLHYFGAGHTDGDSLVHFEDQNVVHMGDLAFNRRHPFIDRSAGANIKSWIQVLDKAVAKFDANTRYVFGHAAMGYEVTGKTDDLKKFGEYLGNLLKFVDGEIKAGKSKEEILKATSIPGSDEWKGDGISRPLEAAYGELTAKGF